ncbi:MAG: hypothetical protein Q8K74_08235 [Candidatus Nitrotoga sp.]|nr:hypothetical protein [Candidatus Nitrotoga sp.]MDP1856022.1 hypothetical protein [Candidatus Nitrotoga sp.]
MTAITLGPNGGVSRIAGNSQAITLNWIPSDLGPVPENFKTDPNASYNVARALKGLRDQLLAVKSGGQCLKFSDSNQITLAFTAERARSVGIKFNLVVLSLDTSSTQTISAGNTLTVDLDFGNTILFQ